MIDAILCRSAMPCALSALCALFIGAVLSGCAQPPARPSAEPIASTASREKLALALQEKGDLAEALIQWKVLSIIEPANSFYQKRAAATRQLIDVRSKSLMLDGVANLNRGARDAARLSFLRVLALDPKNKEAFDYLRQMAIQYPGAPRNDADPPGMCCKNWDAM
ncbi:MAG: hypothetical protein KGM95_07890 [Betaproteobacteria bacterium]|nr:hypothetical protein [Betaproteobacteria bacterium]